MTLREYLINIKSAMRIPVECSPRIVWKFARNFGLRNIININRFEKRIERNEPFFPAFVMISVTESCNLQCSGCWVSRRGGKSLTVYQIDGIINCSKSKGSYFFGILGGEPLMFNGLMDIFTRHNDCYFQLFTNGTLLTDSIAQQLKQCGNVTPLISIEGLDQESDSRRGQDSVFERSIAGIRACRRARLIIGAAASICKSNFDELVTRDHIDNLAKEGVHYLWYYIYRPVGANPNPENALDTEQIKALRRFIVEERRRAPLQIIETYWDADGRALCPAATGLSHHISPSGAVEFCPPLQMACEQINEDGSNLIEIFEKSEFLRDFRKVTAAHSRGCIILENPQLMVSLIEKHKAVDTTSRGTVMKEFHLLKPQAGHNIDGQEIAEQNKFYRFVKKRYFFGFGAYG